MKNQEPPEGYRPPPMTSARAYELAEQAHTAADYVEALIQSVTSHHDAMIKTMRATTATTARDLAEAHEWRLQSTLLELATDQCAIVGRNMREITQSDWASAPANSLPVPPRPFYPVGGLRA